MNFRSIIKKSDTDTLLIFLILIIIVFFLQFYLLDLALKIGFKPDDWALYFKYKTLGLHPLSKLTEVWVERGIYTTYQVYYMGLLEKLVGLDYRSFQVVNLFFKAIATLAIPPLVLVVFKNRLLAFLTTIFFAISYSSIGPLEFAVKGSDYVAIFWMCIFLIIYYLIIKKHPRNFFYLSIGFIALVLTLVLSPIRLYPLLILLPLIEIYLLLSQKDLENFKNSLIRIAVFFLPFIFLFLHSPSLIMGFIPIPLSIFKRVIDGNWHLTLSPLSGIGYTFIANEYWGKIFGSISVNTIKEYILFLLGGPTIIFGILTLIIAFLKSRKPWVFFLLIFTINFILEILVFFIATHAKYLQNSQGLHYEPTGIYSAIFGIYILVLGLACFIEWIKSKKDNLLMALWTGILFLSVFTFATWAFAPFGTSFSGTSYYLVVSSIGSSLFLSAFLISTYQKVILIKRKLLRILLLLLIFIVIISIFLMDIKEIHNNFSSLLTNGRSAHGQQVIQGRFREHIKDVDFSKPALFYFDTSDLSGEGPFYSEGFLASFPFWMHFQDNKLIDGCVEILYLNQHKQLSPYIREQDGQKGFLYRSLCVESGKTGYKDIFYKVENFYAFKIKDRDFVNIKEEVLNELGL